MIPQEKTAAVLRGLHEGFGVTAFEDICSLPAGPGSDLFFRIIVKGSPYLLRIMTRIDERMDPGRIFACMSAAAEAGLAPSVRYSNVEDGISITDFVEAVPFPATRALVQIPGTLRRLHVLPAFPKTFNYVTAHNGFIWRLRAAGILSSSEIEQIFTRYGQVCDVYPRVDSDMVSCHGDLKPENILFDGEWVWLVGWQVAFVNDRYFDLVVAADFLVTNDADELTYLHEYFGQPPDAYQSARFFLMRQVVHMLAAALCLLLGSAGKSISRPKNLPSFRDFHRRIWACEVNLADNDHRIIYGLVHWEELLKNMWQPRFDESLEIVSARNTSREGIRLLLPRAP